MKNHYHLTTPRFRVTLKITPLQSVETDAHAKVVVHISPLAQQRVLQALKALDNLAAYLVYDEFRRQVLYNTGALQALHFILRKQSEFSDPEIMTLGCRIVANLMQTPDSGGKQVTLKQEDFLDALVGLIE